MFTSITAGKKPPKPFGSQITIWPPLRMGPAVDEIVVAQVAEFAVTNEPGCSASVLASITMATNPPDPFGAQMSNVLTDGVKMIEVLVGVAVMIVPVAVAVAVRIVPVAVGTIVSVAIGVIVAVAPGTVVSVGASVTVNVSTGVIDAFGVNDGTRVAVAGGVIVRVSAPGVFARTHSAEVAASKSPCA